MAWADGAGAVGLSMAALGALWVLGGSASLLPPRYAAVPLGLIALLIGPAVTFESWNKQAPVIGLAASVALVVAGSISGEFIVTGSGVLGVMAYLPFTMAQLFGDRMGPAAIMLTSGVMLLVVMLVLLRRRPGGRDGWRGAGRVGEPRLAHRHGRAST